MEAEQLEEVKTRIYVGGLGEKVTADDLTKIFSSLGEVKAVDIVRTKGRSFGYVDFFPSSDKSLSKLLSTYNGCVWKGGRLRLEKAKEHYLARLEREWEEDAHLDSTSAITDCVDVGKDMDTMEKHKTVHNSEKNINIFFPRLRKVKPLLIRGTGKHKYSFQRVEVPPVPKYFCDCEEHSVPSHTAEGKQIQGHNKAEKEICDREAQSGAMNDEELNMMNLVMNKLFERENISSAARHESGLANDGNNSIKLVDDLQFVANDADSVAEEDHLIINVLSKRNKRMAEKPTMCLINQEFPSSEIHTSEANPVQVPKVPKNNNLLPNKKRKSTISEEIIRNDFASANPGSDVNMQPHKNELKKRLGAQTAGKKSGVKQSTAYHSWSQKSSRKALVGDQDSNLFNVSNILPVFASVKEAEGVLEPIEDLLVDENEADEDNLIVNLVSKKSSKMAVSINRERKSNTTMIQKSTFNETLTSESKSVESVVKADKKNALSPKKKRKLLCDEESNASELVSTTTEDRGSLQTCRKELRNPLGAQPTEPDGKQSMSNHSDSQKSSWRALAGDKDKNSFSVSSILEDISAKEEQPVSDRPSILNLTDDKNLSLQKQENLKGKSDEVEIKDVHEGQRTNTNEPSNKSGRGSSWFQKSPWTQLVTESKDSFSITQISPCITFKNHEVTKPLGVVGIENPATSKCSDLAKQDKKEPTGCCSKAEGKEADVLLDMPDKKQHTVVRNNNEFLTSIAENGYNAGHQAAAEDVSIGETCSFMRSAASLKEWANTKAALCGLLKRKNNEK